MSSGITISEILSETLRILLERDEAAIRIDPNDAVAHNDLAFLLQIHSEDYPAAKDHYEAVIRIDPSNAVAQTSPPFSQTTTTTCMFL